MFNAKIKFKRNSVGKKLYSERLFLNVAHALESDDAFNVTLVARLIEHLSETDK